MPFLRQFATLAGLVALVSVAVESAAEPVATVKPQGTDIGTTPFRVLVNMYQGDETAPFATQLVLFSDGVVYDLDADPNGNVTAYDLKTERVILLSRRTKQRASVSTNDLIKMAAGLKASVVASHKQTELGVDAVVQHDGDQYSVDFGEVKYSTTAQTPEQPVVATDFARYADWALRLNIPRKMGVPPFGRMALNQKLASEHQLPAKMSLAINRNGQTIRFRSTHELTESLRDIDREQIAEVAGMIVLFNEVPLKAFPR